MNLKLISIFLSLISLVCASRSASGNRILLVVDDVKSAQHTYSVLIQQFQSHGYQLKVSSFYDPSTKLFEFEERTADHLVLFSSKSKEFGSELSVANIINFLEKGGNVFAATSLDISESIRDLGIEFSFDFDDRKSQVVDHSHPAGDGWVYSTNLPEASHSVLTSRDLTRVSSLPPISFNGIAHRSTGRNPLGMSVLLAHDSAFSFDSSVLNGIVDPTSPFVGTNVVLVSALQTRANSRIVFSGSLDMFTDDAFKRVVNLNGQEVTCGNKPFSLELFKWLFQEKRVLRFTDFNHHKKESELQQIAYRIKDDMVFGLSASQWEDGRWNPFVINDIQIEIVMLDPYIRKNLTLGKSDQLSTQYISTFKLPDHYGVFTFKVEYERNGYSFVKVSDIVEIRPFRHNEYPRFLTVAVPYYVNTFSCFVGFLFLSLFFIFHKESIIKSKSLKKE